ncbi:MAG: hypothetical protein WBO46_25820, partial [Caldilineaceae bacterium]
SEVRLFGKVEFLAFEKTTSQRSIRWLVAKDLCGEVAGATDDESSIPGQGKGALHTKRVSCPIYERRNRSLPIDSA